MNDILRQQEPESNATPSDEEGISSEDEEVNDENGLMTPDELSISCPKERQLTKFLDSIVETFSRTKSIPLAQTPRKNEGTDGKDESLAKLLTTWIRAIASTGKRPSIEKDVVWTRLLNFYKQRLDVYVAQVESCPEADITAAFVEGSNGVARARKLHSLSVEYKTDKSFDVLRRMISIAYELCYEPDPAILSPRSRKGKNSICFLGRLRSAYEAFKETAIQLQKSFAKLSIVCLSAPTSIRFTRSEVEERIHVLARKNRMPQPTEKQIQNVLGQATEIRPHCHVEIQFLLQLESHTSPDDYPFPYIGCSKRSYWLCHQFLSRYKSRKTDKGNFYQTRASHGRIYPLWHIGQGADPRIQFYLSTTLHDIQDLMKEKLSSVPRIQRLAQAESSANVTVTGGALARQKMAESLTESKSSKDETTTLKDFVCSKKCFRIPANGETTHFLSINFYKCPNTYIGRESSTWCIPDFSDHWGNFNLERIYRVLKLDKQEPAELDGEYVLYWCRNDGLPPNRCLMSLLEIQSTDSRALLVWRRLYHALP